MRRAGGGGRRRARGGRGGFTLVEVVIAIVLLGGVLLGFADFTRRFVRAGNVATLRSTASDLATERVELAKLQTAYADVDTLARTETVTSGGVTFGRRTRVRRTAGAQWDFKTVTVTVTHALLPAGGVKKTTVVAAF